jgi:hypothetical protein
LFKDLTRCDTALRQSIKQSIIEGKSPEKVLIELWSSNLFNVTSNLKAKKLKKQAYSAVSYSGVSRDLREPFCGNNLQLLKSTAAIFENYIDNIKCDKKNLKWLERGNLYVNVDFDQLMQFLKSVEIPKESLYVSPISYANYLEEWITGIADGRIKKQIPKINIGVMFTDKREVGDRRREYDIEPKTEYEAKNKYNFRITALSGGNGGNGTYKGDKFFEMDKNWHVKNFKKSIDKKESYSDTILLLFYKLNPNYLGNFKFTGAPKKTKVYLARHKEGLDIDWVLSMGAHTPSGGPMFKIHTNNLIMP